jgi:2-polyprenyl-3-methyl-5-hydroxy-6-metoxy-1,4-benzoquinol methylase
VTHEEFTVDPFLGPAAPGLGWVPAPRYLLRRRRILCQLEELAPGRVIEVGPGAGMLLQELAARGHECHALETSPQARALIEAICKHSGHRLQIHADPALEWKGRFPLVLAFEVLEHIEDDRAAIAQWADWLTPGGTLLMSVPAHPRQWNAADIWAGHYRRYRKRELIQLVEAAGLRVEHAEYLGFPLGNLTERMQARDVERSFKQAGSEGQRQANNDRSGVDRGQVLRWYPLFRSVPGRLGLQAAFMMQAMTRHIPLGNGHLLRATKPR